MLSGGQPSYIAPDHLGAPHQITNARNRVEWQWDHDPFGNGTPTGSFSYNLRFPGQFYDQRSKLNYNYFRDYDPNTGRYIESDPVGLAGGINTYGYAGQNPGIYVDPTGTSFFSDVWDHIQQEILKTLFSSRTKDALNTSSLTADAITNFIFDVLSRSNGFCNAVSYAMTTTPITNGDEQQWLFQYGAGGYQDLQSRSRNNEIERFFNGDRRDAHPPVLTPVPGT